MHFVILWVPVGHNSKYGNNLNLSKINYFVFYYFHTVSLHGLTLFLNSESSSGMDSLANNDALAHSANSLATTSAFISQTVASVVAAQSKVVSRTPNLSSSSPDSSPVKTLHTVPQTFTASRDSGVANGSSSLGSFGDFGLASDKSSKKPPPPGATTSSSGVGIAPATSAALGAAAAVPTVKPDPIKSAQKVQ